MKKYLILFAALVTTLVGANSYAQCCAEETGCNSGRIYVGAVGGVNFLNSDKIEGKKFKFHPGFMGAASVGYNYNQFNGEVEVGYRWNRLKNIVDYSVSKGFKVHSDTISVMGNVIYDIDLGYMVTPYVGAGIGYARTQEHVSHKDYSDFSISKNHNKFAYQGIAGVRTRICQDTDLGIEYRYFGMTNTYVKNEQNVGISLRHFF